MTSRDRSISAGWKVDSAALFVELQLRVRQSKEMRDELLRKIDRFGKQLPCRLLASMLSYVGPQEISRSQTVCSGWKLTVGLLDRLWRGCYEHDWEAETS